MSVLQPVSRIPHWLSAIGAALSGRRILSLQGLSWSRRIDRQSAAASDSTASNLQPGLPAPDFTLPRIGGGNCSLSAARGRRLLLVFVDPHRHFSDEIATRLNRLHCSGKQQVLAVCRGTRRAAALWADVNLAAFPVLVASGTIAAEYNAHDAPLAVEIDEQGHITARRPV